MKIKIDKSNQTDFGYHDENYIKMLEVSKEFEALIHIARKRLNILAFQDSFKTGAHLTEATKEAEDIVEVFDLPDPWIQSVAYFIISNKLQSPGIGIYLSGYDEELLKSGKWKISPLNILITQKISYGDFTKWIIDNKKSLEKRLKMLPRKKQPPSKYFKLKLEVFKLHQKGLTPSQIFKELNNNLKYEKYPGFGDADSNTISKWVKRFKDALHGKRLK